MGQIHAMQRRFPVTSPRGEDRDARLTYAQQTQQFPVTSPRGEDHDDYREDRDAVSSHLPARGGSRGAAGGHYRCDVSSHLPARGGSFRDSVRAAGFGVSSHLPARGGSAGDKYKCWHIQVSSHLPARGGSPHPADLGKDVAWFPVTSPRGEDHHLRICLLPPFPVSSHLPARGGSPHEIASILRDDSFQSPPREGRILFHSVDHQQQGFQSPPREGRISGSACRSIWWRCFQSPPREGRILSFLPPVPVVMPVSSHLPARGGSR